MRNIFFLISYIIMKIFTFGSCRTHLQITNGCGEFHHNTKELVQLIDLIEDEEVTFKDYM